LSSDSSIFVNIRKGLPAIRAVLPVMNLSRLGLALAQRGQPVEHDVVQPHVSGNSDTHHPSLTESTVVSTGSPVARINSVVKI
jgi:hypothetical protein